MAKRTIYPDLYKVLDLVYNADLEDDASRNTVELFELLHKIPDINMRIAGHELTRNTVLSSFDNAIVANDEASETIAAEAYLRLSPIIDELSTKHASAHIYGHQVHELAWKRIGDQWFAEITEPDFREWECYKGKFFKTEGSQKTLIEKGEKYLLNATANGRTNGGIMRGALLTEILRLDAVKEQSNFIKKVKGILQIINKGGDGEEAAAAETAAKTAINDGYLITSDLIEFKLNQIVSGLTPFKEVVDGFKTDIAIGFLGQANTTELPNSGGSRAALNVLSLIAADIAFNDIRHFSRFINTQLLKYDFVLHHGDNPVPYKFKILVDENIDRESGASAANSMLETGLPFEESEIYGVMGMTPPRPGSKIVQSSKTAI